MSWSTHLPSLPGIIGTTNQKVKHDGGRVTMVEGDNFMVKKDAGRMAQLWLAR